MNKETLALDMGGSAVKAGLFLNGRLSKVDSWRHRYNDTLPEDSKADLLANCISFAGEEVRLVGLAIAGLIATDGTVFESTLMSSFDGINIGKFLKTELGASAYSQDNDADCGAVGELHFTKNKSEMLCVVVGSGIGSAALDHNGNILYPVRVDKSRPNAAEMNHPISDVGLVLSATDSEIRSIFAEIAPEVNPDSSTFLDKFRDPNGSVKLGQLGSTIGVFNLLNIVWGKSLGSQDVTRYYQRYAGNIADILDLDNKLYAAKVISQLAQAGDLKSQQAYKLMGRFLGLTIVKAERILQNDHGKYFPVHLGGNVMGSRELFWDQMKLEMTKRNVVPESTLSNAFVNKENANLWGAYLQAQKQS